jgi:hypothetical protein
VNVNVNVNVNGVVNGDERQTKTRRPVPADASSLLGTALASALAPVREPQSATLFF